MDKQFIILSLKHSEKDSPTFWRPDDTGYTIFPWASGVYTQKQIETDPNYYDNGVDTLAIELSSQGLESIGFTCKMDVKKVEKLAKRKEASRG